MNTPKPIGDIVREAYEKAGLNPVRQRKAEDVVPDTRPDTEFSWLGRWADQGWSIRIEPRLTPQQWDHVWAPRADEAWDAEIMGYSPTKSLELLHELFPTHRLRLRWPRCTHRTRHGRNDRGLPVYTTCGAQAHYTETHVVDVTSRTVAIARCAMHRGMI